MTLPIVIYLRKKLSHLPFNRAHNNLCRVPQNYLWPLPFKIFTSLTIICIPYQSTNLQYSELYCDLYNFQHIYISDNSLCFLPVHKFTSFRIILWSLPFHKFTSLRSIGEPPQIYIFHNNLCPLPFHKFTSIRTTGDPYLST